MQTIDRWGSGKNSLSVNGAAFIEVGIFSTQTLQNNIIPAPNSAGKTRATSFDPLRLLVIRFCF